MAVDTPEIVFGRDTLVCVHMIFVIHNRTAVPVSCAHVIMDGLEVGRLRLVWLDDGD